MEKKILNNINVVVSRQVKRENRSLPVAVVSFKNVACLLLVLRIRSAHLETLRFPIGDAY